MAECDAERDREQRDLLRRRVLGAGPRLHQRRQRGPLAQLRASERLLLHHAYPRHHAARDHVRAGRENQRVQRGRARGD